MCTSLLYSSSELGAASTLDTRINQAPIFVVSLFHRLQMGSRPSFKIQRHAVLLMIIRSAGNRFTADSPGPVWLLHSPLDSHETESICSPLGGRNVQVFTTSHQCHFKPVLSLWEKGDIGGVWGFAPAVALAGSWVRIDRPLWSIRDDRESSSYS